MTKSIALTHGKNAWVDDEDYNRLSQWKWQYSYQGYAVRTDGIRGINRTTILMHRDILNISDGMETDHINGDKLDNRRINLRPCTPSENQHNKNPYSNNTSGFKGVTFRKDAKKWAAQIGVNGRIIHLHHHDSAEAAARAYDKAAILYFGKFAKLNFPQENQS